MKHTAKQSNTSTNGERLLGKRELANFLGKSEATVTRMVLSGQGPKYYRVGAFVRFRMTDVYAWLDQQAVDPAPNKAA